MTDVAAIRNMLALSTQVPKDVLDCVERAKRRIAENSARNNECLEFWRGNQYVYRNNTGYLVRQGTLINEMGKPRHRVRQTRNFIFDIVRNEVSKATQRVPDYQILPSTADPDDISAAGVAEKVARFGYDAWHVRRVTEAVVTYAVVTKTGEGFAWPYWDASMGPVLDEGEGIGVGDIRIGVYGPNEVAWEPGVRFEDSRWYVVRQAQDPQRVENMPGFLGFSIKPDAVTDQEASQKGGKEKSADNKLVLVTEYLERPSRKFPNGRRLVIVNQKLALPPEDYPYCDHQGNVVDAPVLHKLSYVIDPDSDRDIGLVPQLLDAQRTYNDCNNKQLEWKNLALIPQLLAPLGAFSKRQRITDEPGAVFTYNPVSGLRPEWRPVPQMPPELSVLKNEALGDARLIASQNDIPNDASGKAIQILIERDANARQSFLARLAEFHSELMRHCLVLVAKYYTEPRLVKVNGRFGPDTIEDFTGAMLRSQVDVVVLPESIEPRTRQSLEQRVMAYAQLGWISGEKAMDAIEKGTAADLVDSFQLDQARAQRILQRIIAGPENFLSEPLVPGPDGTPTASWMPRKGVDSIPVHRSIFSDYAKTRDFEQLDPPQQEAVMLYLSGLDWIERQQQEQMMMQQTAAAQSLGAQNAAKPQTAAPLPSMAMDAFRPQGQ